MRPSANVTVMVEDDKHQWTALQGYQRTVSAYDGRVEKKRIKEGNALVTLVVSPAWSETSLRIQQMFTDFFVYYSCQIGKSNVYRVRSCRYRGPELVKDPEDYMAVDFDLKLWGRGPTVLEALAKLRAVMAKQVIKKMINA